MCKTYNHFGKVARSTHIYETRPIEYFFYLHPIICVTGHQWVKFRLELRSEMFGASGLLAPALTVNWMNTIKMKVYQSSL